MNNYSEQSDSVKPLLKNIKITNNGHHNMTVQMEYDMNSEDITHYLSPGPDLYKIEFFSRKICKDSSKYIPCIVIGPITKICVTNNSNIKESYIIIDSSITADMEVAKIFIEDIREITKL